MRRFSIIALIVFFAPIAAHAGTQTFSTPGSHTFNVPTYGTLTVELWGGGGGGQGSATTPINFGVRGSDGLVTTWGSGSTRLQAGGGKGAAYTSTTAVSKGAGAGGTALNCDQMTRGEPGGPFMNAKSGVVSSGAGGTAPMGGSGGASVAQSVSDTTRAGTVGNAGRAPGAGGSGATVRLSTLSTPGCSAKICGPTTNTNTNTSVNGEPGGGGGAYCKKTYAPGSLPENSAVNIVVGARGSGGNSAFDGGAGAPGRVRVTWTNSVPGAPTCSVAVSPGSVNSGESATLRWNSSGADTFFIRTIGYVNPSGSTRVQPSRTTTYNGMAMNASGSTSCTATLSVNTSAADTSAAVSSCPRGFVLQNGTCVSSDTVGLNSGACVQGAFCRGNEVWLRTASCTEEFDHACPFGCAAGGCLLPPPAVANITATPTLMRPGNTTTVTWESSGMQADSCRVRGTSGDAWNGNSGTRISRPIRDQTTFTLSCTTLSGSSFVDSVTIGTLPVFREI